MPRYVLDPGHGGHERSGSSTPIGVSGPGGSAEKDITLRVATALRRFLPGALLTRSDDRNLALGARADVARRAGADVFLSVHANQGRPGTRGAEVWVHPRSGPGAQALAARVRDAMARCTPGGATVQVGELAVLDPARLGGRTDACLLELDYLSDGEGEVRLNDPREIDRIARALAEALAPPAFGRGAPAQQSGARALQVAAPPPRLDGIDIYELNDNLPSWARISDAGFRFVIHKTNEYIADGAFVRRWPQLGAQGFIRGTFNLVHASRNGRPFSPEDQVDAAVAAVKRLVPGDLGPSLDLEDRTKAHDAAHDPGFWVRFSHAYLDRIEAALGRTPIVYTQASYWIEFLDDSDEFTEYPLWIVDVNHNDAPLMPGMGPHSDPKRLIWSKWTFWQWHYEKSASPMPTPFTQAQNGVDLDHFNGTISELRGLADLGHPAPHVASNTRFIAYADADRRLRLFTDVDHWLDWDLTDRVPPLPVAAGDPAAIGLGDEEIVVYRAADDHVYALTRTVGRDFDWVLTDITAATGAAAAVDDPCVQILFHNEVHVVYWDVDDHQAHLMRVNGDWHVEDMSTGAPRASGSAALYMLGSDYHVVSRAGAEGHLVDLHHVNGRNPPDADDLTATAHTDDGAAVPAATYRPSVLSPAGAAPRIVFRAVRGAIWQIERDTLAATNLGAAAGAPNAVGSPSAVFAGEAHILYRGGDGTVIDLWDDQGTYRFRDVGCNVAAAADPVAFVDGGAAAVTFLVADGSFRLAKLANGAWSCEAIEANPAPPRG